MNLTNEEYEYLASQARKTEASEARAAEYQKIIGACICGHDGQLTSDDCPYHGQHPQTITTLRAERDILLDQNNGLRNDLQMAYHDNDELRRQLTEAQATAKSNGEMWAQAEAAYKQASAELLEKANEIRLLRFERMAPIDWRDIDETPLGQALDGIGDEVEP